MIVLDASVVVELLRSGPLASSIMRDLALSGDPMIVPHLLDLEVANALRGLAAARRIDEQRCAEYLADLAAFPAERHSHTSLLGRIWELRHNFSSYDAAYIALSESTGSALFTCDAKLAKGHHARVLVFREQPRL